MRACFVLAVLGLALSGLAVDRTAVSYATARPVLDEHRDRLPAALRNVDEAKWNAWTRQQDAAIRARLEVGDLDSMVNFLLFGTSFTKQPRVRIEGIVEALRAGTVRARVDDLVAGLVSPGDNERLVFLRGLLRRKGINPQTSGTGEIGMFLFNHLRRVLEEKKTLAEHSASANPLAGPPVVSDAAALLKLRSGRFRDRGLSLDTSLFPNYSIEQALRDLKKNGLLREGRVSRVAVIGPGLDFTDKNEEAGYDYYPQQTMQPFFLYDSLARLRLAKAGALSVSVFDISPRLIEHLQSARERARKNTGYVVQLPYTQGPWPAGFSAYWRSAGDQVGAEIEPIQPPQALPGLRTRAVRIRPGVVLACDPLPLNIVLERIDVPAQDRFDVVVGTNVFLYYDDFERALALENAGAMLKPGGILLSNDLLPELPGGSMRKIGITDVRYATQDGNRDAIVLYQKTSPK